MPTTKAGKVRRLLHDGKAVIVSHTPFAIKLTYETNHYTQSISLGIDAGAKHIGLSATTDRKELFAAEINLRTDIVDNLSTRREARRTRRSKRSVRYRAPRFDNRKASKKAGWLAPSVQQKIHSHVKAVQDVCRILPVSSVTIEVGQFDTQWLRNPGLTGTDYQHGPQLGFWNVREYVLFRDNHQCKCCHGKSNDKVLNVHHIESRKTGGDSPDNLITLCETCHKAYHKGEMELKVKRNSKSLRDAAFMNIMRWSVYDRLKVVYPHKNIRLTYGYITKHKRIEYGIEKTHCADAFCIAGNMKSKRNDVLVIGKYVPRHSRSLHIFIPTTGGKRRSAIASHWIGKSRLQRFDTVKYEGRECIISGSTGGRPVLRNADWTKATRSLSVNSKTVKFLSRKHGSIIYQMFNNQHV